MYFALLYMVAYWLMVVWGKLHISESPGQWSWGKDTKRRGPEGYFIILDLCCNEGDLLLWLGPLPHLVLPLPPMDTCR